MYINLRARRQTPKLCIERTRRENFPSLVVFAVIIGEIITLSVISFIYSSPRALFFFACKRRPFHLFVIQRTHQSLASYTSSEFSPIAAVPFFFVAKKKPGQNKIRYFSSLQLAAAVAAVTQAQAHPRRNTRIQTQRNEDYRDELAGEWRDLNLGNQFRRDFLPPAPARMCNNENNS